jgi:hypothetical protein
MSKLIDFYLGEGKDQSGRTIEEVWRFKHGALEVGHDYVQWLFPTIKSGNFNPDAPTLTVDDVTLFKSNPKLKENLLISFDKILDFFGLRCVNENGTIVVRKGTNFIERKSVLFEGFNHNHLRVTRVIDCLNALGFQEYAKAFFDFLSRQKQFFTENCFHHWEKAMRGGVVDQARLVADKALFENLRVLQNKLSRTPEEEEEMRNLIYKYYVENEDVRAYWKSR